jgi:hypothetical protein
MSSSVQIVEVSMLGYLPTLVAWLFGIVMAVVMVRRGGSKAEKLLLAGCSLMFITALAGPLLSELVQSLLFEEGMSNLSRAQMVALFVSLPRGVLSLAGFICLVYAFWVRFIIRGRVPA